MSTFSIQVGSVSILSLLAIFATYNLARRELLSFRYTVGWLLLFSMGLFSYFVFGLINPVAKIFSITPAALLALGGVGCIGAICLQLSISISGLHQRIRVLTEEVAHLRLEVSGNSSVEGQV